MASSPLSERELNTNESPINDGSPQPRQPKKERVSNKEDLYSLVTQLLSDHDLTMESLQSPVLLPDDFKTAVCAAVFKVLSSRSLQSTPSVGSSQRSNTLDAEEVATNCSGSRSWSPRKSDLVQPLAPSALRRSTMKPPHRKGSSTDTQRPLEDPPSDLVPRLLRQEGSQDSGIHRVESTASSCAVSVQGAAGVHCYSASSVTHAPEYSEAIKTIYVEDGDTTTSQFDKGLSLMQSIGDGGQAEVFLAHCAATNETYAVKRYNVSISKDRHEESTYGKTLVQVRREAAALKKVRHNHVIRIHAVIDDPTDDSTYFVMPYYENTFSREIGATATTRCKRQNVSAIRSYIPQLCMALEYCHRNGIVHHDMKPANILFSDAERTQLVVIDFGVTTLLESERRSIGGTLEFTPIEALLPDEVKIQRDQADYAATIPMDIPDRETKILHRRATAYDIWSLGVILYMLLEGKVPFEGGSRIEIGQDVMDKLVGTPPGRPRGLVWSEDTPMDFRELVLHMLHPNPFKRPKARDVRKSGVFANPPRYNDPASPTADPSSPLVDPSSPTNAGKDQRLSVTDAEAEHGYEQGYVRVNPATTLAISGEPSVRESPQDPGDMHSLQASPIDLLHESLSRQSTPPRVASPKDTAKYPRQYRATVRSGTDALQSPERSRSSSVDKTVKAASPHAPTSMPELPKPPRPRHMVHYSSAPVSGDSHQDADDARNLKPEPPPSMPMPRHPRAASMVIPPLNIPVESLTYSGFEPIPLDPHAGSVNSGMGFDHSVTSTVAPPYLQYLPASVDSVSSPSDNGDDANYQSPLNLDTFPSPDHGASPSNTATPSVSGSNTDDLTSPKPPPTGTPQRPIRKF